jgi:hypothetical protein
MRSHAKNVSFLQNKNSRSKENSKALYHKGVKSQMLRTPSGLKMYDPDGAPEKYLTTSGPKSPQNSGTGRLLGRRRQQATSVLLGVKQGSGELQESAMVLLSCCMCLL